MTAPLWQPRAEDIANSELQAFIHHLRHEGAALSDYDALYAFSIAEPEAFWSALWDYFEILGEKGAPPYLKEPERMPGARFFPRARLNFAENLLAGKPHAARSERANADAMGSEGNDAPAIVFWSESGLRRTLSWADLRRQAARVQAHLATLGIAPGDRVAAIVANVPEAIAAMLGATAEGAVWSSCSPDFGVAGVLDRFAQIAPRVLFVTDGYCYAGKVHRIDDKLPAILEGLPSVERVIVIAHAGDLEAVVGLSDAALSWDDVQGASAAEAPRYRRFAFSHPLYILFSSGTTGAPKCIVHGAGGTLLQHLKEHRLHCDLRPGERLFYFTTCGWMMWNWLVSGLASGAVLMLYDGSPFHPTSTTLFDYAEAERINIFGTSAKYIDALKKAGARPRESHDLASVRLITSTGSVLAPEGFDYVYDAIKPDVHLASISGGTDIVSCFVLGNPLKPVWRGEIQGAGLGMAVDIFDEAGRSLPHGKGELVCTKPFPSMPTGFWGDEDGSKYARAYFERFPGVWHHGDFAERTEHGGFVIHGRSDATLNPGGVRIGTAEIYRQVENLDEVIESIVVGQDWEGDVRIVLFVVLREGVRLDDELCERIRMAVRTGASPRHVPAKIIQVADIPRTKSGKITELAVRDVIHGRAVKNKEALANPEALALFEGLEELQS